MNLRWIRHLLQHRVPPLVAGARGQLAVLGQALGRVGRRYGRFGRRHGLTAGAAAARGTSRFVGWCKRIWTKGRTALAENPALARRFVFGALLLVALVTAIWIVASNGERSPAAPLSAAPISTTTKAGDPGPAPGSASSSTATPRSGTPAPATPAQTPAPAQLDQPVGEYTVAPGDTLAGIALRHNVPFDQLASRNGIRNPNKITAGATLSIGKRLPGTEVLQPGDALRTYAQRYGISEEQLTVLNPQVLKPPGLLAGAGIRIAAAQS